MFTHIAHKKEQVVPYLNIAGIIPIPLLWVWQTLGPDRLVQQHSACLLALLLPICLVAPWWPTNSAAWITELSEKLTQFLTQTSPLTLFIFILARGDLSAHCVLSHPILPLFIHLSVDALVCPYSNTHLWSRDMEHERKHKIQMSPSRRVLEFEVEPLLFRVERWCELRGFWHLISVPVVLLSLKAFQTLPPRRGTPGQTQYVYSSLGTPLDPPTWSVMETRNIYVLDPWSLWPVLGCTEDN